MSGTRTVAKAAPGAGASHAPLAGRTSAALIALALASLLAACAPALDRTQLRTCAALGVALSPPGFAPRLDEARPGGRPGVLVVPLRGDAAAREIECAFAGAGLSRERTELEGLILREGARSETVSGASLHLLRQELDANRDGLLALVPAEKADASALPRVSAPLGLALQQGLAALPAASVTALLAAAYALVYGLVGRIVLAFGEFAALAGASAFAALLLPGLSGADPLFAFALVVPLVAGLTALQGGALLAVTVGPLARRDGRAVIIATLGLAIALGEALRLLSGGQTRWLPPVDAEPLGLFRAPDFTVTAAPAGLLAAATAIAAILALLAATGRTRFGRRWRAVADDPLMAALCGVDERRVLLVTLALAAGLAGLVGGLTTALYGGVGWSAGFALGLKALAAAVLGGVGSVPAALLGGLVLGFADAVWSAVLPLELRDAAFYALLVAALTLRPNGLFDRPAGGPRRV